MAGVCAPRCPQRRQTLSSKNLMIRIPITLARRPGFENDPQSFTSPVIDVTIAAVPYVHSDGTCTKTSEQKIRVLLDTGADLGGVDERLLKRIGSKSCGPDQATTKSIHGEHTHNLYFVSLLFPGMSSPFGAYVTGLPLQDGSRAYEAILGMEFLKLGRLVIDAAGESYFELRD